MSNVDAMPQAAVVQPRRRGGRSPKRKGSGFEREVVAFLQELGLAAERVPLSAFRKAAENFQ